MAMNITGSMVSHGSNVKFGKNWKHLALQAAKVELHQQIERPAKNILTNIQGFGGKILLFVKQSLPTATDEMKQILEKTRFVTKDPKTQEYRYRGFPVEIWLDPKR
jgi:hypothetical protein